MELTYTLSENPALHPLRLRHSKATVSKAATRSANGCHNTLKRLGLTPNYIGFHQVMTAVECVHRKPDLIFSVTKGLYPAIAMEYGTSWKAVERNIRSMISMAWDRNPSLLKKLAGYPLSDKPKAAQFIAMLSDPR